MEALRSVTLVLATISIGLMAGVFGLYANTIMPGLRKTDDRTFVGAFQSLDRAIINPLFMTTFFAALLVTAAAALLHIGDDRSALPWIVAALVLYLATFAITVRVHVPRNDAIKAAGTPRQSAELATLRQQFDEATWATWNMARALMTMAAFACLVWALVLHGRAGI
jgi:uncharacterized membrane protein